MKSGAATAATAAAIGVVVVALICLSIAVWTHDPEHHGVDEICKAFPSPDYRRPITYAIVGPDAEIYATGECT